MPTATARWLKTLTGEISSRKIARELGVSHATILRWERSGIPPSTVIKIVAARSLNLYDTLEDLGWITDEERNRIDPARMSTEQVAAEAHRLTGIVLERLSLH